MNEPNSTYSTNKNNSPRVDLERSDRKKVSRHLRIVIISSVLTVLVVAAVYLLYIKSGILENLLVNYFGPPKVTFREANQEHTLCPPLRNETNEARSLEEQLADQAAYVLRQGTWFQYDASQDDLVRLTKLYSWYGDDFTQVDGSPIEFAARYSSELNRSLKSGSTPQIRWLDYDWSLNDKKNKSPR